MFPYFILGLSLLVGGVFLARWFTSTDPRRVVAAGRWVLALLGLIAGGYLVWGGRQALAALALPMLLPVLLRSLAMRRRFKAAQGPSPGQSSQVRTRFLEMILDHDSGEMTGRVREGSFARRRLEDLDLSELVALWRECRTEDAQSAAVLEAYLDRAEGDDWREAARADGEGGPRATAGGPMNEEEALGILGLAPGASRDEVRDAYRRLMQKVHPDHGGSSYLAAKINEAKDFLLRG